MAILVVGGAGYIGSHAARKLREMGEEVVVYDNLSTGYAPAAGEGLVVGDISETWRLQELMQERKVDAVLHFAAKSQVGESMKEPELYYRNNVAGTLSLLRAMKDADVRNIVFSSTAAVYGNVKTTPITEEAPPNPESVYGRTKLMAEQMMQDFDRAYGLKYIALRYFNVAGAHPSGDLGEAHDPETHLIPNVLKHMMDPTRELVLYGTDFPTKDGTCVRDYVQIEDLISAHLLALRALRDGHASTHYNLGSGEGFSNREIIEAAQRVTGKRAQVREEGRRAGDPAVLTACSDKIEKELGWTRQCTSIDEIVASAWKWHSAHPTGYSAL